MKRLIYVLMLIMIIGFVYAQPIESVHEELTKNEMFSKIDLEHKNTRKYVSDELTRQREQFYKEIDSRATYYEREGKSMLSTTYWKLGLIIGGMIFFTVGLNQMLKLKIERTRFSKLQKHLSEAIIDDIKKEFNLKKNIVPVYDYNVKVDPSIISNHVQDIVQEKQNVIDKEKLDDYLDAKDKKLEQNIKLGENIVI